MLKNELKSLLNDLIIERKKNQKANLILNVRSKNNLDSSGRKSGVFCNRLSSVLLINS